MEDSYAIVITTINSPTRAVLAFRDNADRLGAHFVIIGDSKSPPDFSLSCADYLDLDAQRRSGFRFAELCPEKHYARKNVGYLAAARAGASIIIETDDDNIPGERFWRRRRRRQDAPTVEATGCATSIAISPIK